MLDTYGRKYVQPIFKFIGDVFIKLGFSANQVTILSFIIGIMVGPVFYFGYLKIAVILLWISGILDAVDGTIARKTGNISSVGTLMDITFDRIVECGIIIALAYKNPEIAKYLVILTTCIILSMTIFLTIGALSEKKGEKSFYYQAGVAERTEGFLLFSFIMLFNKYQIFLILFFSFIVFFTAIQRFFEGVKKL